MKISGIHSKSKYAERNSKMLDMFYKEEKSRAQIARELKINPSTVASVIRRGY